MDLGRFALAATTLLLGLVASAPQAQAQSIDPAAADVVFRKGREAAEKGDWATACPKFAESQRLDPAPGTLLNLADCEEHLGKVASAYGHFKTALETMAPNDDRIPFAKKHLAEVEKKVPHLTLNASGDLPASARVMRDDVQLGSASFGLPLPVDPGAHVIVVAVAGRVDRRVTLTLKNGEAMTLTLHAGDSDPAAAVGSRFDASRAPAASGATQTHAVTPRTSDNASATSSRATERAIAFTAGGVGIAAVAVGVVAGITVLNDKSTVTSSCGPDHGCTQAGVDAANAGSTWSTVSTVAFIGGGAAVAAGAVLFVLSRRGTDGGAKNSSRGWTTIMTRVTPESYPGGAGVRVIGSF